MYRKFAVIEKFEKPADKAFWVCETGEFSKFAFEKCADYTAKVAEAAEAAKAAKAAKEAVDKTNNADEPMMMAAAMEGAGEPMMMEAAAVENPE